MSENLYMSPESYKELKKLYGKAVKEEKDRFVFQGRELVTGYVKYLLEHLRHLEDM